MYLTRHQTADGQRWAADGQFLPYHFDLSLLLDLPANKIMMLLESLQGDEAASGDLLAPHRRCPGSVGQRRDLPAQPRGEGGRIRIARRV